MRLSLLGLAVLLLAINAPARTVPDPNDAVGFFTTVTDKLLRSTFSFGITNIPVLTNGMFVYTPAVQRLLQVTANLRDASTTNFYPTVYRPIFYRDPSGNVFITGYEQVVSAVQSDYPLAQSPIYASQLPAGINTKNVYDVPWIIGVKKDFPGFNQFVMRSDFQITRKLEVTRLPQDVGEGYSTRNSGDFHTNQMFIMSITNHMGFSFWNSYSGNYVALNSPLSVVVRDNMNMVLSNGVDNGMSGTAGWPNSTPVTAPLALSFNANTWPGSAWDFTQLPSSRQAAANSFANTTFDYPFLPQSVYVASSSTFAPLSQSQNFEVSAGIAAFPLFMLMATNGLQAYILDGNQIIDYVQMSGPSSVRNLSAEIQDVFTGNNNAPYRMWYTNNNLGYFNQIIVSQKGPSVAPANSWMNPGNLPAGVPAVPAAEAAFFEGFFLPNWNYSGKSYVNTNLAILAPYTPTRLAYSYTIWQANDPLVHYLSSDLNDVNYETGLHISDDPINQPPPAITSNLTSVVERYQPWGRALQLAGLGYPQFDTNGYNLAYRDPLVWGSDDWNFPATNGLPLTTLGQVHRGTPWQSFYLKATNILDLIDTDYGNANPEGLNTWLYWTGDFNTNDASLMSPTSDWRLAALITALFNPNDAAQLASVNTSLANWPQLLDGITALTNSTAFPNYYYPPELDPFVMTSNSPQATFIASGITTAQANRPGQTFASVGDLLSAPELSTASPWLNASDPNHLDYDISDAAYEAIPSQLLPRLRPDSTGVIVFTNGIWSVQFSGADGFDYAVQTSTDLVNWKTVCTNQPVQGMIAFPVAPATAGQNQFYRSALLP